MNFSFTLLGFVVAVLVTMTGVGGGSLMTPVLILGLHVAPIVAVGTDLLYSAATKAGALCIYARRGQVHWGLAGRMLSGSLPAAGVTLCGLWLLRHNSGNLNTLANLALSLALACSATAILFREQLRSILGSDNRVSPTDERLLRFLPVVSGIAMGVLVSLSSVGAGVIGVTALLLLFPRIDTRRLVGTDIAHGLVLALLTGVGHLFIVRIDFSLLGQLLLGTLPGIYVGTRIVGILPETTLRRAIAFVLLGVAVKLVV